MHEIKNLGSCFGGHGISHKHLDSLNKNLQKRELEGSINKLLDIHNTSIEKIGKAMPKILAIKLSFALTVLLGD